VAAFVKRVEVTLCFFLSTLLSDEFADKEVGNCLDASHSSSGPMLGFKGLVEGKPSTPDNVFALEGLVENVCISECFDTDVISFVDFDAFVFVSVSSFLFILSTSSIAVLVPCMLRRISVVLSPLPHADIGDLGGARGGLQSEREDTWLVQSEREGTWLFAAPYFLP